MKTLRSRLRSLSTVALLFAAPLSAQKEPMITIGVSPPRVEIELDSRATSDAIRVFNFGGDPMNVSVAVHSWSLDQENRLTLIAPDETTLDQWMIINPTRFEIPPGGSQTVRFAIRPKVEPTDGEYRAMVYFQQEPDPDQARDAQMQVVGRIGVAVYAYAGEVRRVGELHGVRVNPSGEFPQARFDISSLGSAHVRMVGQYAIWPAGRYPGAGLTTEVSNLGYDDEGPIPEGILEAGLLPTLPVLPEQRRMVAMQLGQGLPPGQYVLDVNGDLSGTPLDLGIPFTVGATEVALGEGD